MTTFIKQVPVAFAIDYMAEDGITLKRAECMPGTVTVLYGNDVVTIYKGTVALVNAERYDAIINADTNAAFESFSQMKAWIASVMFSQSFGGYQHSEIVLAVASGGWTSFEDAPCYDLHVQNTSGVDILWHKGNEDHFMILKNETVVVISGITNASQVRIKLAAGEEAKNIYAEAIIP